MSLKYFAITVFYIIALAYIEAEVSARTEKDLRRFLFEGQAYDKLVRPVKNPKTAVPVTLGLIPIALRHVDFEIPFIKVDSWLEMTWQDEYLKWNPVDFADIEELNLPVSEVWSPDLSLYTGAFESSFYPTVKTNVVIRHTGEVIWVPPISIHNRCGFFNYLKECVISIMSWTYDVSQMDITISSRVNESLVYFEDTYPRYHLKSLVASKELKLYNCCPQPYAIIHFTVALGSG